jgi:hypothetical protein
VKVFFDRKKDLETREKLAAREESADRTREAAAGPDRNRHRAAVIRHPTISEDDLDGHLHGYPNRIRN